MFPQENNQANKLINKKEMKKDRKKGLNFKNLLNGKISSIYDNILSCSQFVTRLGNC